MFSKFNHGQSVVTIRTWFVLWVQAWKLHEDGRVLDLVEMKLQDMPIKEELKRVANIALLCIQSAPSKRPTMSNVVAMLSGDKIAEEATRRSEFTKEDDFESLIVNVIPSNPGLTTVNEDSPLLVGLPTSSTTSTGILQLSRMISRKWFVSFASHLIADTNCKDHQEKCVFYDHNSGGLDHFMYFKSIFLFNTLKMKLKTIAYLWLALDGFMTKYKTIGWNNNY